MTPFSDIQSSKKVHPVCKSAHNHASARQQASISSSSRKQENAIMSHETSNHTHCPDCVLGDFARNHYFTGKLLVERDFTDEQRFHIDKLRHHHQRLHGWGV